MLMKYSNELSSTISARVTVEELEKLQHLAEREQTSLSCLIRTLLFENLEAKGEGEK